MSDQNKPLNKTDGKRLDQGRGKGTGKDYIPFIQVGEFSSTGESIRVYGNKTQRIHHLHSGIEYSLFLLLNRYDEVIDIREQFPIPLIDSLTICQDLGIKHPQSRGELSIVTTDFVVNESSQYNYAVAVKPSEKLQNKRIIEKLQIEKTYWESRGYKWFIFTEKDISPVIKANLKWLKPFLDESNSAALSISMEDCQTVIARLEKSSNQFISKLCGKLDDEYQMKAGYHIEIFRYLVALGQLRLPLTKDFHQWQISDIKFCFQPAMLLRNFHAS